jgi:hypothetical protein
MLLSFVFTFNQVISHVYYLRNFKINLNQTKLKPNYTSTKKIQQGATVHQNFISYLYEAQHVSRDTPPIIRNLKLH